MHKKYFLGNHIRKPLSGKKWIIVPAINPPMPNISIGTNSYPGMSCTGSTKNKEKVTKIYCEKDLKKHLDFTYVTNHCIESGSDSS